MYTLLVTIAIIISIFLIIVVLLQSSKGGGLAGTFGGGGAAGNMGAMFGTRRTADFLSRATWWLGGALLVLAIVINLFFLPGQMSAEQRQSIIQQSRQQNSVPTQPALPPAQTPPDQGQQENPDNN